LREFLHLREGLPEIAQEAARCDAIVVHTPGSEREGQSLNLRLKYLLDARVVQRRA
jgi:hypothetical protein